METPTPPVEGMSFFEHLGELRRRVLSSLLAVVVSLCFCYPWSADLFQLMQRPLHRIRPDLRLSYLSLSEPFFVHLKVAAIAGLFGAMPFITWQVWLFVAPGLYRNEKRYVAPFVILSSLCFLIGALFAFEILFPAVVRFFLEQAGDYGMTVTLDRYFSDLIWTVGGVALTFELPVVIGILARLGVVTPAFLLKHFAVAVVACLVIAALITPSPDAMNMLFVAVPMVALYSLGILVAKVVTPREASAALVRPEEHG